MSTLSLWHLYLVRTASGALYTGITTDVTRRVKQHQAGTGAKALRGKGPLQLAFSWQIGERGQALKMEYRIKQLNKEQKERLVAEKPASLEIWLEAILVRKPAV
ncbi:GIY-YIG nuclease family protein [Hafnia paralvei]|uniref:GIY-YIG nuclease family protein n=1 Tax=Hafnia paralvei TaxID=546367 RepID=UPI00300D309D